MLHDLIASSQAFDAQKFDYTLKASSMSFSSAARLWVPEFIPEHDGRKLPQSLALTEHAHRQLFDKLGRTVFKQTHRPLPYDYMMAIAADLRADILNRHCYDAAHKQWKLRAYQETLRAVVDENFPGGPDEDGDYEITQLLKIVQSFYDASPEKYPEAKLFSPSVSPDELHVKMTWRDVKTLRGGDGGNYGMGCYFNDYEIGGGRRGKILPYIQRTSCGNSIIYAGKQAFEWVHRGYGSQQNSRAALRTKIQIAIGEALVASAEVLDRVIEAEAVKLDDFAKILDGLALKHGWAQEVKTAVAVGTEGKQTVMGVVNGITFAAHTTLMDIPSRIEMEMLGGNYLFQAPEQFQKVAMLARQVDSGFVRMGTQTGRVPDYTWKDHPEG